MNESAGNEEGEKACFDSDLKTAEGEEELNTTTKLLEGGPVQNVAKPERS